MEGCAPAPSRDEGNQLGGWVADKFNELCAKFPTLVIPSQMNIVKSAASISAWFFGPMFVGTYIMQLTMTGSVLPPRVDPAHDLRYRKGIQLIRKIGYPSLAIWCISMLILMLPG